MGRNTSASVTVKVTVKLLDKGRPYYGCPNTQIHTYSFNRWLVSRKLNLQMYKKTL